MTDIFSAAKRSHIMSKIRSKWTSPEVVLHNYLKSRKVRHVMHPKMLGNPDTLILDTNTTVFIDGCFWHGCPKHGHIPKSKKAYWKAKIKRNKNRDRRHTKKLISMGYGVVRIWECQTKDSGFLDSRLERISQHKKQSF